MDYCNDQLLFLEEDGRLGWWAPRWYAITVWRDEHGHTFATPVDFRLRDRGNDGPKRVDTIHCECGQEYAVEHGARVQTPRCRICENAQRAAEQRRRRARGRTLAIACMVCGAPLSARRSSRKYCSPACRQRAHRKRGVDAEAM